MDIVKVAKALSDPLRWEILKRIAAGGEGCGTLGSQTGCGGVCVCELVEGMGLLQSKVSYHIKELREAGLVREETRGRWNYYHVRRETLKAYLDALKGQFDL